MLPNPLGGVERPKYLELAQLMVRMWVSFVNFGDPNVRLGGEFDVSYRCPLGQHVVMDQRGGSAAHDPFQWRQRRGRRMTWPIRRSSCSSRTRLRTQNRTGIALLGWNTSASSSRRDRDGIAAASLLVGRAIPDSAAEMARRRPPSKRVVIGKVHIVVAVDPGDVGIATLRLADPKIAQAGTVFPPISFRTRA